MEEFETYADVIDSWNISSEKAGGKSLTDYIKDNNIKIKEIDMDPLGDLGRALSSKAHGGSVGIEVLFNPKRDKFAEGGWSPGVGRDTRGYKSDHGSYSGGGGDGKHHPPVITPKKKPIGPIKDDTPPWYSPSTLINNPLLNFINPKSKLGLGLGIFKTIKNFQPSEEDIKISDLPSDNLRTEITKDQKKALGKQKMGYGLGLDGFDVDSIRERIEPLGNPDNPATNEEITTFFSADGGRVGFANGGSGNWWDGLEGEALSIYNSMNAYGASDAEIQSKLQGQDLWSPDGTTPNTGQVTGIINQNITGRDGPGGSAGPGAVTDFYESITERQNRLNNPGKIQGMINTGLDKLGINKQNSVQEMLSRGMLGPKDKSFTGSLPFGISGLLSRALPDGYGDMSLGDQITTQSFMGYTDPNTNMGNKDPFGLNVRSMFGNYVEKAGEIVDTLEAKLAKNGYLSPYDQQRFDHYKNVTTTKQSIASDLGLIEIAKKEAKKKAAEKAAAQLTGVSQLTGNVNTGGGKGIASSGVASGNVDPSGMGGGSQQAKSSGSQDTGRDDGGWGWREGGLATMFTRRR